MPGFSSSSAFSPCPVQLPLPFRVAVIGGGPAGLMAAQTAGRQAARRSTVRRHAFGRPQVPAGRQGRHEHHARRAYADFRHALWRGRRTAAAALDAVRPAAVRDWVHGLGVDTFVGTSSRVFPTDMKAAPLLRAWLHRLREAGVQFHMRHRWLGWQRRRAGVCNAGRRALRRGDAVVLALGGGSWARLGSDGAWVPLLASAGVAVAPLAPANCGFDVDWSAHFSSRFAGQPLNTVAITSHDADGLTAAAQGPVRGHGRRRRRQPDLCAVAALREQIAARRQRHLLARPGARPQP